ncbi:hypothetical protein [Streptomyces sp. NBC_01361]|uniref:hypothetical protein n=1 Tax=Streptomyces sp. NBC_01361 TaxID=2903838 RepID=UPI002E3618CB|nr:hypothetical protein [Streptomyces sp. NBC_01361]
MPVHVPRQQPARWKSSVFVAHPIGEVFHKAAANDYSVARFRELVAWVRGVVTLRRHEAEFVWGLAGNAPFSRLSRTRHGTSEPARRAAAPWLTSC